MTIFGSDSNRFPTRLLFTLTAAVLVGLTVLASYAWSKIRYLSLPVSPALSLLAVLVPLLNLSLLTKLKASWPYLSGSRSLNLSSRASVARNPHLNFGTALLLILDAVLITLSSTHIPSSSINCSLQSAWASFFKHKDAATIRTIQDALNCCGFNGVRDKAYPFPAGTPKKPGYVGPDACAATFHRTESCGGLWQTHEQKAAVIFVTVGAVVAGIKLIAFAWMYYRAVKEERRGVFEDAEEHEQEVAEETRRRIEDVTENLDGRMNGEQPTERSMLLPSATRDTPWGEETGLAGERDREQRETLI